MAKKSRNLQLDLFKGLAILAIMAWHFEIVPRYYLIWAIPAFLFITSALYQDKWQKIKFKKIFINAVWIFGLIFIATTLFYLFKIPNIDNVSNYYFFDLNYFIFRNSYLGQLWYFLLYFQLMIGLYILAKLNAVSSLFLKLNKWQWGLFILIATQIFSFILLTTIGKGITINIVSWLFLIWLALFYYQKIQNKISKLKNIHLIVTLLFVSLIIISIYYLGGEELINYLLQRTHDFIFFSIIIQLLFLLWLFLFTELLLRFVSPIILKPILIIGKYSLYVYLFHQFFYFVVFENLITSIRIGLSLIFCVGLGYSLDKINRQLKKL